jgi:hypothetical protein
LKEGVPKKYSSLILNNSITLKYILLDRGKANLNFDILQLYIYKKLKFSNSVAYFWMCKKFAKNGVSNINQALLNLKTYYYQ